MHHTTATMLLGAESRGLGAEPSGALASVLARELPTGAESLFSWASKARSAPVIYLSTPITTGRHYLAWLRDNSDSPPDVKKRARREVYKRNIDALHGVREQIRATYPTSLLIDPTDLSDQPGWHQPDYHRFWSEVIASAADAVVFADGWQYSVGCTIEYAVALLSGKRILDAHLRHMDTESAWHLLEDALDTIKAAGADDRVHRSVIELVRRKLLSESARC